MEDVNKDRKTGAEILLHWTEKVIVQEQCKDWQAAMYTPDRHLSMSVGSRQTDRYAIVLATHREILLADKEAVVLTKERFSWQIEMLLC